MPPTTWRALISVPLEASNAEEALDTAQRLAAEIHHRGGDGFLELLVEEGKPIAYEDADFRALHGLPVGARD